MKNYKGNPKYIRDEKGGLAKEFYQELKMGKYGEEGIKFFERVEEFLKNRRRQPGFKFWMLLWFMLRFLIIGRKMTKAVLSII
ncbi:MAG: hypothetical protein ACUVR0_08970 [Candidatus Aminicenantales bacterium]